MGYSAPKKQLDLKEFLSKPAKKRPGAAKFGFQRFTRAPAATQDEVPAAESDAKKPSDS